MLILGVSFGSVSDPFTCSTNVSMAEAAAQGLDLANAQQMRDFLCKDKGIDDPASLEEVMVIYSDDNGEPIVQHWHHDFS
jgi:hypothetical protein